MSANTITSDIANSIFVTAGGTSQSQAYIKGVNDITLIAGQDINIKGGSQIYTHAYVQSNSGNIVMTAGQDMNLTGGGTSVHSNANAIADAGNITATAGGDITLKGSCTIPTHAYFETTDSACALTVNAGGKILLVGNAYFTSQNKNITHGTGFHEIFCSTPPAPVNPVIPASVINGAIPGDYYYEYIFLYELFYRLRYFYQFPVFEGPYWNFANYTSP